MTLFFVDTAGDVDVIDSDSVSLSAHCVLCVVKPVANPRHDLSSKLCDKLFKELLGGVKAGAFELEEEEQLAYGALRAERQCSFGLSFVGSETDALKIAGERLNCYAGEKNGPTTIALKSLIAVRTRGSCSGRRISWQSRSWRTSG